MLILLLLSIVATPLSLEEKREGALQSDDECDREHSDACTPSFLQHRIHSLSKEVPAWSRLQLGDVPEEVPKASSLVESDSSLNVTDGCWDGSRSRYSLNWEAKGASFFDEWTFVTEDMTNGAVRYVSQDEAHATGIAQAFQDHAVLRVGAIGPDGRRPSAKLHSKFAWDPHKSFLVAMKYRHVPFGPGIWPAFWMVSSYFEWPKGGELDIVEFASEHPSMITFHTKGSCRMNSERLRQCTPSILYWIDPQVSTTCDTDYSQKRMGCHPPQKRRNGQWYNMYPGTVVTEWNDGNIKVWHFSSGDEPDDLLIGRPRPETWGVSNLLVWFPFDAASCQGDAFGPQELIFNTELCGDLASGIWDISPLSYTTGFQSLFGNCKKEDCCANFMKDQSSNSAMSNSHWDIEFVKVFTPEGKRTQAMYSGTYWRGGKRLMNVGPEEEQLGAGPDMRTQVVPELNLSSSSLDSMRMEEQKARWGLNSLKVDQMRAEAEKNARTTRS